MSIIEICFLRFSAKDANWIREKFRNLPPGELLDPNDRGVELGNK
ncbi:hypothetical protein [Leptospira mayottensis]|nr:hypothetical protein [Leptospira mayottensis]